MWNTVSVWLKMLANHSATCTVFCTQSNQGSVIHRFRLQSSGESHHACTAWMPWATGWEVPLLTLPTRRVSSTVAMLYLILLTSIPTMQARNALALIFRRYQYRAMNLLQACVCSWVDVLFGDVVYESWAMRRLGCFLQWTMRCI